MAMPPDDFETKLSIASALAIAYTVIMGLAV